MHRVVLGLGSNLSYRGNDSLTLLKAALGRLEKILDGLLISSFYRTTPQGVKDQPDFINCAAAGFYRGSAEALYNTKVLYSATALYNAVCAIETEYGRNRSAEQRRGPRTLDIDILLFGDLIINEEAGLVIPHPELKNRRFALEPLLEILPNAIEPGTGKSYRSICDSLPFQGVTRLI